MSKPYVTFASFSLTYAARMEVAMVEVLLEWLPWQCTVEKDDAIQSRKRKLVWNVIDVSNGDISIDPIVAALELAKSHKKQPTFINIKTTIGYGTSTAGTFKSHHGTYSDEDATLYADLDVVDTHTLSTGTKSYFKSAVEQGRQLEEKWNLLLSEYKKSHPQEAEALQSRLGGTLDGIEDFLLSMNIGDKGVSQAARQYNEAISSQMMERVPNLMASGADLLNSDQMGDQGHRIFDRNHYNGGVIRYGLWEHAMASISNGIAAYAPGALIPVTATFFMFYLCAAPGVRMGALSNLQVIQWQLTILLGGSKWANTPTGGAGFIVSRNTQSSI